MRTTLRPNRRTFLAAAAIGAALLRTPLSRAAEADPVVAPVFGNPTASKRLVLWGSLTCGYTAILVRLLGGIVVQSQGKVAMEWRHYPIHAPDPALHVAALSLRDEKFWLFADSVLGEVVKAGGKFDGLTKEKILALATAQGGTQAGLDEAAADAARWQKVKDDFLAGRLMGVTRTPGLFYNGYFLTPDGLPTDTKAFDAELRKMLLA